MLQDLYVPVTVQGCMTPRARVTRSGQLPVMQGVCIQDCTVAQERQDQCQQNCTFRVPSDKECVYRTVQLRWPMLQEWVHSTLQCCMTDGLGAARRGLGRQSPSVHSNEKGPVSINTYTTDCRLSKQQHACIKELYSHRLLADPRPPPHSSR